MAHPLQDEREALPPLPDAAFTYERRPGGFSELERIGAYTADQMRDYAREAIRAALASLAAPTAPTEPTGWRDALKFYADRDHFMISDDSAWDTVSGEPSNFWCDEEGTATVEDGTVAARALAGTPLPNEDDETEHAAPTEQAELERMGAVLPGSGETKPRAVAEFNNGRRCVRLDAVWLGSFFSGVLIGARQITAEHAARTIAAKVNAEIDRGVRAFGCQNECNQERHADGDKVHHLCGNWSISAGERGE